MLKRSEIKATIFNATVIISALGYFVDIYDLVLFSIVRVQSLKDLGVADTDLLNVGVTLLNLQMGGMLVGGLLWGVLGDKRGRLSVLFGSILLYSSANVLNSFVETTWQYGLLRFIAGVGLAGELGAAITLVSETLSKTSRGFGTSLVAGIGVTGAALAAYVGQYYDWRTAYFFGGVMGLALLVLRIRTFESGLFESSKSAHVSRGDFLMLFRSKERLLRYLYCILVGVPIWYVIGILITFSPEICRELGATGPVSAGSGILYSYMGLAVGDIGSGLYSQYLKSRKKAVYVFLLLTSVFSAIFLLSTGKSPTYFYALCFALGCATGYWALFVTIAAEQFGTNLRATVTTTVPNFVRGSVIPVTLLFQNLGGWIGLVPAASLVGMVCLTVAFLMAYLLKESFHADLDFLE